MLRTTRGATLPSVMLLLVALTTLGLLAVRSATRELRGAGAQVARERAHGSASAVLSLAQVRLAALDSAQLRAVLSGSRPQGPACDDPCRDCVPRGAELIVDQPDPTGTCLSPPCARPGAVARLRDATGTPTHWCDVPLRQLLDGGDADARVSVWVRNDRADGLDGKGWRHDEDGRVVLTVVADVRGARVVLRESVALHGN